MKGVVQVVVLIIMLLVGVPLVVGLSLGEEYDIYGVDFAGNKLETPQKIKVWDAEKEKIEKVDFEEYVCRVVASEMPSEFHHEALKAQAVAARTYAMSKIQSFYEREPEAHPDAPLCNGTHCQVCKSEKVLIDTHQEGWEKDGYKKIKKACKETEGQLLYYEGQLVTQPLFFSSSGGQTENSEDVFTSEYPYLVSVSSPYEDGASHTNEMKSFTLEEIKEKINDKCIEKNTGDFTTKEIKILSRTAGGRVDKMQIGQSTYRGTEIRNALGLSSALFSLGFEEEGGQWKVVFTSNGYGHGVGMSQYGANGMANEGSDYIQILTHYYSGTKVY